MLALLQNSNTVKAVTENARTIRDVAWSSIDNLIDTAVARLPYIAAGFLVLLLFYGLAKLIKYIFLAASKRTSLDRRLRILFSRLIVVFVVILGIFTSFTVIIPTFSFGDLIAGLGFTSFVIGFATKDILNNLLSGVLILWQQPFSIGDQLFVGNHQGKVEYIGVRATSLRKDDGELVLIPNGDMYSSALTIRGAGAQRRMSLKFSVGFDADVDKVKDVTRNVLAAHDEIVKEPRATVYVTEFVSDGVNITANFWINTNQSRPLEVFDSVASDVLEELNRAGVEIFPPGSVIVQQAEVVAAEPKDKRSSELDG